MSSSDDPEKKASAQDAHIDPALERTEDFLARPVAPMPPRAPGAEIAPNLIGRTLGRFRVITRLGAGGMGEVFLAEDSSLRRNVALKLLPTADTADKERRRRFLREARAATAVVHPNITTIYEVGTADEFDYIAMEHVKGQTLRIVLGLREDPLPIPEALRITREVARGLGKAHEAGIVHRDIKPENIMINDQGAVKILDFGLAKWIETSDGEARLQRPSTLATMEGQILGTPSYMSPEQAEGRPLVDARTDIFSLGIMLYEMVSGKLPFSGSTVMAMMIAISRDAPIPLAKVKPDIPKELTELIHRCLEKEPGARFADGNALANALDEWLSNPDKLVAPPPDASATKPVKKSPKYGMLVATVLGFSLPLLGVSYLWTKSPVKEATPASPAMLRICMDPGDVPRRCSHGVQWCNASGALDVCCGEGLVPTGPDHLCSCAPGGTNIAAAIERGCKPSTETDEDRALRKRQLIESVYPCFDGVEALEQIADGDFSVTYLFSAQGEVVEPRVKISTIPNEQAQRCALEKLRAARVDPPRAEEVGRELGFGFTYASLADLTRRLRDGGVSTSPPAASASASVPSEPPLRFPCAAPRKEWPCAEPNVLWCDSEDKPIACCSRGLMATGVNGLCACPPGGVTRGASAPASCPVMEQLTDKQVQATIRTHFEKFRACYAEALRNHPRVEGRVNIRLMLTPEGRVFKTQIRDASLPDPDAQTCLLEAFRTIVFDPPADGTMTIGYPLLFSR